MRTLFLLGIALITFLLGNSLITSKCNQYKTLKTAILVSDADCENLNLMIKRSPVDKMKENFELFVKKNVLQTTVINCKNGKYFGITPTDDYGYFHVVFLEIHQGKIINIHYDELKSNGKNKEPI